MASSLCQSPVLNNRESNSSLSWWNHTKSSLYQYEPLVQSTSWSHVKASSSIKKVEATPSSDRPTMENSARNISPSKSSLNNHTTSIKPSEQNYSNHASPDLKENSEQKKKRLKKDHKSLVCYMCQSSDIKHAKNHLFFGPVQCVKCGINCGDCLTFKLLSRSINDTCEHSLVYPGNPVNLIISKITGDSDYVRNGSPLPSNVHRDISKYVNNFRGLANKYPWSAAIKICQDYLSRSHASIKRKLPCKERKSSISRPIEVRDERNEAPIKTVNHNINTKSNGVRDADLLLSQNYDLLSLDQAIEYVEVSQKPKSSTTLKLKDVAQLNNAHKTLPNPKVASDSTQTDPMKKKRKRAKSNTMFGIPKDEYYLIKTEPIEECPMCYTVICPSRFCVNSQSYLVTYVCIQCDLKIYFVISPAISIVTDNSKIDMKSEELKLKKKRGRPPKNKDLGTEPKPPGLGPGFVRAADFVMK